MEVDGPFKSLVLRGRSSFPSGELAQRSPLPNRTVMVASCHGFGGSDALLFVRRSGTDEVGTGAAFLNLGRVDFAAWNGSERPLQVTWGLQRPMTEHTFLDASVAS